MNYTITINDLGELHPKQTISEENESEDLEIKKYQMMKKTSLSKMIQQTPFHRENHIESSNKF